MPGPALSPEEALKYFPAAVTRLWNDLVAHNTTVAGDKPWMEQEAFQLLEECYCYGADEQQQAPNEQGSDRAPPSFCSCCANGMHSQQGSVPPRAIQIEPPQPQTVHLLTALWLQGSSLTLPVLPAIASSTETLTGKPAKGPTAAEWADVFARIWQKGQALKEKFPEKFEGFNDPRVSFDHDRIHDSSSIDLSLTGFVEEVDRHPLVPLAPDCNKVIEHVHGIICQKFQDELASRQLSKAQECQDCLEQIFYSTINKDMVERDVRSLKQTYDMIRKSEAQGGSAGGWPEKKFR